MGRGAKPGERRGGRKKGTPNKITLEVKETLDALGCNPMELSARIALGEELDGPHPALTLLHKFADKLAKLEDKGGAVTPELIEELRALVDDNLTSGYVPLELRSKHIADLMQYAHPKRKPVDHAGSSDLGISDGAGRRLVIGFVDADEGAADGG